MILINVLLFQAEHVKEIEEIKNSGKHTNQTDKRSFMRIGELEVSFSIFVVFS